MLLSTLQRAFITATIFASFTDARSTTRNALAAISDVRNATIHTHTGRVTALSHFDLTFITQQDTHVKFTLEPNHDVIAADTTITHLMPDGQVSTSHMVDRLDHKVYRGEAWMRALDDSWERVGWARIVLKQDVPKPVFEGGFSVGHLDHHIQSAETFEQTRHLLDPSIAHVEEKESYMVVWRDTDVLPDLSHQDLRRSEAAGGEASCGADGLSFNADPNHPLNHGFTKRSNGLFGAMEMPSMFSRRQSDGITGGNTVSGSLVNTIGNPAGCPTTRKVALVGIATDCTYTQQFASKEAATTNIINLVNVASAVYESTFNISLGLANLTIMDATCPGTPAANLEWNQGCSGNLDISDRLSLFSVWRGQRLDNNAYWTLLSTCNTGSAIGLAWLGQACVNAAVQHNGSATGNGRTSGDSRETVSGANVVVRTRGANEWQVFAHETGHTFGARHDCTSASCQTINDPNSEPCCPLNRNTCDANQQFMMNPSANNGINRFSPCSIGNICSAMGRNFVRNNCLSDNRRVTTITGQQCGNGIVEPGEDCDCGGTANCGNNQCCDASTCKFKNNAVCDDSNEDCCRGCQFATNGTVCRASTGSCDPQETCPGNSPLCPEDRHANDGDSCGNGLQCASGQCTSRELQCQDSTAAYGYRNATETCDDYSCVIWCRNSNWQTSGCYGSLQNFLDGTSCGGGGKCSNGVCRGSGSARRWFEEHKEIVIGVASGVGGLIVLLLLGCIFRRCCGRKRKTANFAPVAPVMQQHPGGWYQPPQRHAPQHPTQGWFDNSRPQQGGWTGPPVPPPTYTAPRERYA